MPSLRKVQQLKAISPFTLIVWASVWVSADVDFIMRFPSNGLFCRQNRCRLRIDLHGSANSELSATTMAIEMTKNSERAHSTIFGRFLYCHCMTKDVKNDWNGNVLSLKSLRSSRLWFNQEYPYRDSSYDKIGAYCAFFKSGSLGHVWPIKN